uniref:EGF-like domain-containing protein n=1 Tax=Macrostomum lignano TaxID=282301 RepID=A0A1I8FH02_9PLAT
VPPASRCAGGPASPGVLAPPSPAATGTARCGRGQSHVFEQNCARHNCTCSPGVAGSDIRLPGEQRQQVLQGWRDRHGDRRQRPDALRLPARTLTARSPSPTAELTCRDIRTGEAKQKGQQVTTVSGGVTYICTCAGVDGFQNCRTEEAVRNEGRCLDAASGSYVERDGAVLHCTCGHQCLRELPVSALQRRQRIPTRKAGEKVTVENGGVMFVCDCAGLEGYRNCLTKEQFDNAGKCKDIEGRYVDRGQRYRCATAGCATSAPATGTTGARSAAPSGPAAPAEAGNSNISEGLNSARLSGAIKKLISNYDNRLRPNF